MVQYIHKAVNILRNRPDIDDPSFPGRDQDRLFRSDYDHIGGANCIECDQGQTFSQLPQAQDTPVIHYGLIASGNAVIRSAKFRDRLRDTWNVSCFEMEAAGLMNHFPCLVIRGICDYSDGHKSKIWQPYAAITAAAYAKDLLRVLQPETVTRTEVATDILQEVSNTLDHVDENVREIAKTVRAAYNNQVLDLLSLLDYQNQQSDIISNRQEETGKWLLETSQFQHWQETPKASLLCHGIPGAGKTIMASIVIDHLYRQLRESSVVGLAYLYCNYRRQDEETFINLLSSLLKQLCLGKNILPESVNKAYEIHQAKNTRPSTKEILTLLHTVIETHQKVYIVVDAVDDISTSNGTCRMFLAALFELQQSTGMQIFATSRFNADISKTFEVKKSVFLEIGALDDDIRSYIQDQFTQMQPFILENDPLQSQIKEDVVKAADGMFLLAKLYLDSLRDEVTPKKVRLALETLSKTSNSYDTMYEDIMARIHTQRDGHKALAVRTLKWITCAQRPLTTLELQHALAMGTEIGTFEKDDIPDLDIIISVCCGIVTVDEKSHIVRLLHFAAQEYFDRNRKRWFGRAHSEIAIVCLASISIGTEYSAKTDPEDKSPNVLFEYSSQYCGYHGRSQSERNQRLFEMLNDETIVSAIANHHSIRRLHGGPCYDQQASNATGLHLAAYFGFHKLIMPLVEGGISCNVKDSFGRTPLAWAAARDMFKTANVLLKHGASPNIQDDDNCMPILWAAEHGHERIVRLLLEQTSVHLDARHGYFKIVKMLIHTGANPNLRDDCGRHSLSWAAVCGHESVVRLLLEQTAVDIDAQEDSEQTALMWAAVNGHLTIAELLIRNGANPNIRDDWGRHALSHAAECGHEAIVRVLVEETPVNINNQGTRGRTAVMWAAMKGHRHIVELLLHHDADAQIRCFDGKRALEWALGEGHDDIAQILLQHQLRKTNKAFERLEISKVEN